MQAGENVAELIGTEAPSRNRKVRLKGIEEVVADKGYPRGGNGRENEERRSKDLHAGEEAAGANNTGRANPRSSKRSMQTGGGMNRSMAKQLLRKRGELIERSFAHCYDTGRMRRTRLRGHQNILKRLLIHVGAFNLSLIFRNCGIWYAARTEKSTVLVCSFAPFGCLIALQRLHFDHKLFFFIVTTRPSSKSPLSQIQISHSRNGSSTTDC